MKKNQAAFTLIEVVIVMAILGFLIVGILKGEQLVNSARVKKLAFDFTNIPVYIMTYQDQYRAFPGDDPAAAMKFSGGIGGNGNGIVDGNWNDMTGEPFQFWQDLRLAKLMPGYITDAPPTNAQGGRMGITSAAQSPIIGMRGAYVICSDGILGKFVKDLDTQMDDGNTATGSMMVVPVGTVTPTQPLPNSAIDDASTYLVCMGSA